MKGICFTRWKCAASALIMLAAGLLAASPKVSLAQIFFRRCEPCVPCPTTPSTAAAQPGTGAPSGAGAAATAPGTGGTPEPSPAPDLFAQQDVGAAGGAASAAPSMIGDFLGINGVFTVTIPQSESHPIFGAAPLPGAAIPRFKMADNTSPMPQDRVYFDYDYYHDVPINAPNPNIDVDSYAPGFEKTFLGGLMSFELRLPMATTLDNRVFFDGTTSTSQGEIGDLAMAVKGLLIRRDTFALSGGLAITVPTAKDSQYYFSQFDTSPFMTIANRSVHLMPFFGGLWTPNDRLFAIGYFQVDVDVSGDPVTVGTTASGSFREPTMLYLDASLGYWVRRSDSAKDLVTGFAPVVELHMNQSLDASSAISTGGISLSGVSDTTSILDLTVGAHVELRKNTMLTAGYCTPLTSDRAFDGEFRFFANYRF